MVACLHAVLKEESMNTACSSTNNNYQVIVLAWVDTEMLAHRRSGGQSGETMTNTDREVKASNVVLS